MIAERTIRFVIAACVALAIMCFQTWWRVDNWDPPLRVAGFDVNAVTPRDGVVVLVGAGLVAVIALLALVHPQLRRCFGVAIALIGIAMLAVTLYDLVAVPSAIGTYTVDVFLDGDYHATPILYFAAVTSFLIALAGAVLARVGREDQSRKAAEKSAEVCV